MAFVLRQWGAISVSPDELEIAAVRACVTILRLGGAVAVFPEGTRSRDGRLQPFRRGAARMALLAHAPVLPAGILGTFEALPPGALLPKPVKLRVRFGRPFELEEYYGRRLTEADVTAATRRLRDAVAALLDTGEDTGAAQASGRYPLAGCALDRATRRVCFGGTPVQRRCEVHLARSSYPETTEKHS